MISPSYSENVNALTMELVLYSWLTIFQDTEKQRDKENWRKSEPQPEVEIEDNFERKKEISISAFFRSFVPSDVQLLPVLGHK